MVVRRSYATPRGGLLQIAHTAIELDAERLLSDALVLV